MKPYALLALLTLSSGCGGLVTKDAADTGVTSGDAAAVVSSPTGTWSVDCSAGSFTMFSWTRKYACASGTCTQLLTVRQPTVTWSDGTGATSTLTFTAPPVSVTKLIDTVVCQALPEHLKSNNLVCAGDSSSPAEGIKLDLSTPSGGGYEWGADTVNPFYVGGCHEAVLDATRSTVDGVVKDVFPTMAPPVF